MPIILGILPKTISSYYLKQKISIQYVRQCQLKMQYYDMQVNTSKY